MKSFSKKAKILFISGISTFLLTSLILMLSSTFLFFIPNENQNQLINLINNRKYEEAINFYNKLDSISLGFGKINRLRTLINVGISLESNNYEDALTYSNQANGTATIYYDALGGKVEKEIQIFKLYNFENCTKDGYDFVKWDLENYKIEAKIIQTEIWLKAIYEKEVYTITYNLKGAINDKDNPSSYTIEDEIVLKDPSKQFFDFVCWRDQNFNKISKVGKEIIGDLILTPEFTVDNDVSKRLGLIPELSSDKKTITYGLYPQTQVSSPMVLDYLNALKEPEINGWYLYNNNYYCKKPECQPTRWYKCEPIKRDILSINNNNYFLLSNNIIDNHIFYSSYGGETIRYADDKIIYPNNYEHSSIRKRLNNDFYNTAFAFENSFILNSLVDNSIASAGPSTDKTFLCNNTEDKVFLPSYSELEKYYLNNSQSEILSDIFDYTYSDWVLYDTYNKNYRLRTPGSSGKDYSSNYYYTVYAGDKTGLKCTSELYLVNYGVRPAIIIDTQDLF